MDPDTVVTCINEGLVLAGKASCQNNTEKQKDDFFSGTERNCFFSNVFKNLEFKSEVRI